MCVRQIVADTIFFPPSYLLSLSLSLSRSLSPRFLLSEFGRGSPGGPCRSNGLLLIALIQVRNIGFNDV